MVTNRISQTLRRAWQGVACATVLVAASANALAAGAPLILDSQRGINDGQPGVVLQNAPLGSQQMVPMQQLGGVAPPSEPYIVAPYVDASGRNNGNGGNGGNSGNGGGNPARAPHHHRTTKPHAPAPTVPQ